MAPRWCSSVMACIIVSGGGGSIKSKCTKSVTPSFSSVSTVVLKLLRSTSGQVCSGSAVVNDASVYSLKHLPGRVRPARPHRCFALACEMGATSSDSMLVLGLNTFCFETPGSTT